MVDSADELQPPYHAPITPSPSTGAYITIESASSLLVSSPPAASDSVAYMEVDSTAASRNNVLANQVYAETSPVNPQYQQQAYVENTLITALKYHGFNSPRASTGAVVAMMIGSTHISQMSRDEADALLLNSASGAHIVRESAREPGKLVLTVKGASKSLDNTYHIILPTPASVYNVPVRVSADGFRLSGGVTCSTLDILMLYYSTSPLPIPNTSEAILLM